MAGQPDNEQHKCDKQHSTQPRPAPAARHSHAPSPEAYQLILHSTGVRGGEDGEHLRDRGHTRQSAKAQWSGLPVSSSPHHPVAAYTCTLHGLLRHHTLPAQQSTCQGSPPEPEPQPQPHLLGQRLRLCRVLAVAKGARDAALQPVGVNLLHLVDTEQGQPRV